MPDGYSLDWKGDDVKRQVRENAGKFLGEFALEVEGESKRELRRGHGVKYGTLRRSIHAALPGYDWGGDDVEPGPGTPERGGFVVTPEGSDIKLTVSVGSGLKYAAAVNQRLKPHGSFVGYHYMNNGLKKAQAKRDSILAKYKVQR